MRRFPALAAFLFLLFWATVASAQVRVVYTVDTVHEGQYTAHVMLTNMTSTPLRNWEMTFRMDQHVTQIEHAAWSEFQNVFTVKGQGWTSTIQPGDVVWFTITGVAYGANPEIPRSCFFNGASCSVQLHPQAQIETAAASEMIVSAWIEDYDYTTYTGYLVVQNPTDHVFPATWGLQFTTPSQVMEMEDVIWSRSGTEYQLYGNAHTDRVDAHDFVLIPFRGVHSGVPSQPTNCRLNGVACTFQPPDALVEIPDLAVFFKLGEVTETEWEGYIRIENPTKNELSSWVLRFSMDNRISEAEDMILERSGSRYTIRPAFGRGRIMPESDYTFAIRGTYSDSLDVPTSCTLNSVRCAIKLQILDAVDNDVEDDGGGDTGGGAVTCASPASGLLPQVNFRFLSVQATTYLAFLDIVNTDQAAPIKDWALEFQLVGGMTINTLSSGTTGTRITWQLVGGNYRVVPEPGTNCILPGATVRLNVIGNHTGLWEKPVGCNFGGNICVFSQRMASVDTEEEVVLPTEARLDPAWPNPFNPQSTLSFEVARSQPVRVELFDTLGRSQGILFDGYAAAGSPYQMRIDGSNLASGVYLVRLTPESGSIQTQKVILQK
jgi:hypothetical protein